MGVPKSPTQVILWVVTQITLQTTNFKRIDTLQSLQTMGLINQHRLDLHTKTMQTSTGKVGQQVQANNRSERQNERTNAANRTIQHYMTLNYLIITFNLFRIVRRLSMKIKFHVQSTISMVITVDFHLQLLLM